MGQPERNNNMPNDCYILYSAPLSLYSGKARSFLRKSGLAFRERLPTHPDYQAKVMPKTGKHWLPVLEAPDGAIIQDTTEIIDYLVAHGAPSPFPETPCRRMVAMIIELFGDEGLLRPAMHYRWNFPDTNSAFIAHEFKTAATPASLSDEDRTAFASAVMEQMSGLLPGLGVTDETIPFIEECYLDLLAALEAHFKTMPYLLGFEPTIADYGLIGPLYAHLGRDPYPASLMRQRAPRVARWVERMNATDADVPEFDDAAPFGDGDGEGDEIPPTVLPVLRLIASDYLPELLSLVETADAYLKNHPEIETGQPVTELGKPRAIGFHAPKIRGREIKQAARHYPLWMLGRIQDVADGLGEADRQAASHCLEVVGLGALLAARPARRIERREYLEVWGATQ